MNVVYVEGIPGGLYKYFKKNKRNLIKLDDFIDKASNKLKVTQFFTHGRYDNLYVINLKQICSIKINAILVLILITW